MKGHRSIIEIVLNVRTTLTRTMEFNPALDTPMNTARVALIDNEKGKYQARLDYVLARMYDAHTRLDVYKITVDKILELSTPYVQEAETMDYSRVKSTEMVYHDPISRFRTILDWYQALLDHLEVWSSWDLVTLLVRRDRVKLELSETLQSVPAEVLDSFQMNQTLGPLSFSALYPSKLYECEPGGADVSPELLEKPTEQGGEHYCICDGAGCGEMVACHDENCKRQWFHLQCIGLAAVPEGLWYCKKCNAKHDTNRRHAHLPVPADIWIEVFRLYAEETAEALKAILSSEDEIKSAMQLRGSDALSFLDLLDKTMDSVDVESQLYSKCLHALRKLGGRSSILPTSCVLRDTDLQKKSNEPLASGGFADVWIGTYQGRPVALKVIRVYGNSDMNEILKSYCREVILWKWLSHPNVVPFLGVSMTLFPFCMVCEWMENGSITAYLKTHPSANRLQLLIDIAKGLQYLHSIGVVHGDLKGGNILVDDSLHARLSDFGLTAVSSNTNGFTSSSVANGSYRWMAPELLSPELAGLVTFQPSAESDMYALGMVILEVFTGCIPFHEVFSDATVIFKVMSGIRPEHPMVVAPGLSDDVWQTVEACWKLDKDERPSILSVLECLQGCLSDPIHLRDKTVGSFEAVDPDIDLNPWRDNGVIDNPAPV